MAEKSKKNEAYVQFAKLQRAEDAKKATSEYEIDRRGAAREDRAA